MYREPGRITVKVGYWLSRSAFSVWLKVLHGLKIYGREHVPGKGAFVCAANHVSFADPPAVGVAAGRTPVIFMAKKALFDLKGWGWWFRWVGCIPIEGTNRDFKATKSAIKKLKDGDVVAIFPEGTRSSTGELQEPELGISFVAEKAGVPVVPMFVNGTNKALARGKKYKIGVPVSVYVGKPVNFEGAEAIRDKRERYMFMGKRIMNAIAGLRAEAYAAEGKAS
ncbi:MAG: lysophospholipid acyltransferase family protein [Candidatus Omnitrophota bacterium]